jgi:hypothetical protein
VPQALRVLSAIALVGITVTAGDDGDEWRWHLTPLPELERGVLSYLELSESMCNNVVINSI